MKKIIALLLVFIFSTTLLAGCGGNPSDEKNESSISEPEANLVHHELWDGFFIDYAPEIWKEGSNSFTFNGIENGINAIFLFKNVDVEAEAGEKIGKYDVTIDEEATIGEYIVRKIAYMEPMFGTNVYYCFYYVELGNSYSYKHLVVECNSYDDFSENTDVDDLISTLTAE